MSLIDIWSGERFEPGFYSAEQRRFWYRQDLKKDGSPDRRVVGNHVGVSWVGAGRYHSGRYVMANEAQEQVAAPLRARMVALEAELEAAKQALLSVYAGPKPVSQNQ